MTSSNDNDSIAQSDINLNPIDTTMGMLIMLLLLLLAAEVSDDLMYLYRNTQQHTSINFIIAR